METKLIKIDKIFVNENNPRFIRDAKFEKLVKSVKGFSAMLKMRPIIVDENMVIIGGNMRLKACEELGWKEVPHQKFTRKDADEMNNELEEAERKTYEEFCDEFTIKDNVQYGEWEMETLANNYESTKLEEWNVPIPSITANENIFSVEESENGSSEPRTTDDNYSTFELIMQHENKLTLLDTLNKVKNEFMFEKQEEALMEILRTYNK